MALSFGSEEFKKVKEVADKYAGLVMSVAGVWGIGIEADPGKTKFMIVIHVEKSGELFRALFAKELEGTEIEVKESEMPGLL